MTTHDDRYPGLEVALEHALQATLGPGDAIYIRVCGGMKSNPERRSMDWSITGGG